MKVHPPFKQGKPLFSKFKPHKARCFQAFALSNINLHPYFAENVSQRPKLRLRRSVLALLAVAAVVGCAVAANVGGSGRYLHKFLSSSGGEEESNLGLDTRETQFDVQITQDSFAGGLNDADVMGAVQGHAEALHLFPAQVEVSEVRLGASSTLT